MGTQERQTEVGTPTERECGKNIMFLDFATWVMIFAFQSVFFVAVVIV